MKVWKLTRCPCRLQDVTQALFIKPSQDFLSWAFFLLSRHILCVLLLFPDISPLGKVLLETFKRGEHVWMQLGRDGITGWSKTELPTLNIFRAALCSEQWLAATDRHRLLHSQWLWSQDCWTWYTPQLDNYFWYLHFGVDGARRTKQRTSTWRTPHLGETEGTTFRNSCNISFFVRSGELQSGRRKKLARWI